MDLLINVLQEYWLTIALGVIALYLALRVRVINRLLPAEVRKWLDSNELADIILHVAKQAHLDEQEKREAAGRQICLFFAARGIQLPDRKVNLVLEWVYNKVKEQAEDDRVVNDDPVGTAAIRDRGFTDPPDPVTPEPPSAPLRPDE